jgi:hypothetical protein
MIFNLKDPEENHGEPFDYDGSRENLPRKKKCVDQKRN